MANTENTEKDKAVEAAKAGNAQVQALTDKDTERGYAGTVTDPTPNENYTVAGVTSGAPTPETDKATKADVVAFQQDLAEKNSGLAQ